MHRKLIFLALAIGTLTFSGCFNATEDEQTVPWSRPADWEQGAPGF